VRRRLSRLKGTVLVRWTLALALLLGGFSLAFGGTSQQGLSMQGLSMQGLSMQGLSMQGLSMQGLSMQGLSMQGLSMQGTDRVRTLLAPLQSIGIVISPVQLQQTLQGLQPPAGSISSFNVAPSGAQLQAGPGTSASATQPGSFIYVPSLSPTVTALKGTVWNMVVVDTCIGAGQCTGPSATCVNGACIHQCTTDLDCASSSSSSASTSSVAPTCIEGSCTDNEAGVPLYIADVEVDSDLNSSKYTSNDDVYLYTVYYRQPSTGQWSALCPLDLDGKNRAMAVPLNPNDWQSDTSRAQFTFACTGSGVAAKCARNWGYKPWKTVTENVWQSGSGFASTQIPLAPFYDACLIAARAAYCQDGQSYTENGTTVDLFDTLDGFTSINSTVGTPFAPFSSGVMLHDEYQISALQIGSSPPEPYLVFTPDQLASFPPDEQPLLASLQRSGMESSRYATLDPGRSCPAAPYIDRCDPKEPYDCYRAANMGSQPYGAFLAVNSPRHCSHDENTPGEALDPLCNECVNRVCQVDPTCCGDPGTTFFPGSGSLLWDNRCTTLRQQVCKSSEDPNAPLWPTGTPAPLASSHTTVYLGGAVGSFEGISTAADGSQYAEGWACDPDFPGVSSPIQITTDSELGTGATPTTASADRPLVASWQAAAAANCGGSGQHGFQVPLPSNLQGHDVYVYGIDLNVPGAPFTLLRGGHKTIPNGSALNPQAAIWTGWVRPQASGQYQFQANADNNDLYRVWVNGTFVAGNWFDTDPTAPGAFGLNFDGASPTLDLQQDVPYGVRVEYLRPKTLPTSSHFELDWNANGVFQQVPQTVLYSTYSNGPTAANGLVGTYFAGGPDGIQQPLQTIGALDANSIWTNDSPPIPTLSVASSFAATFVGQVVPPISGDYTFTAATDGTAQIKVNGQLVTNVSSQPTGFDADLCGHDICSTGAAISRTCPEGFFCSGLICDIDPSCCAITWDTSCTQEVASICQLDCNPTPPAAIALAAGTKNDIEVDYQHQTGGAELHLNWALPGANSAVVPSQQLMVSTAGVVASLSSPTSAPSPGNGINAAYFSDTTFTNETLDHVEATASFQASSPPDQTLANSIICDGTTCSSAPGAIALRSATMSSQTGGTVPVTVFGAGAAQSASFSLFDGGVQVSPTPAVGDNGGGTFSFTVALSPGSHTLTMSQTVGGQQGPLSAPLSFTAADPLAPAAPTVTVPTGGFLSGNGQLQVSGTAAKDATVNVTVGGATTTFTADGNGSWSGALTLPSATPGSYSLSITQTIGGVTSVATATASVSIAFPPLIVSSPSSGTVSNPVTIIGSGADPSLGDVIIGDGDGEFFANRGTVAVEADGTFSGPGPTLDYGQHQLKIFQSANGLDGTGVVVAVQVIPPVVSETNALTITSPASGSTVGATITVVGSGGLPRTGPNGIGTPGTVIVYEGTTPIGKGPRADDGSFSIPLTLTGVGPVTLSVTQTASSLSGGGPVESQDHSPSVTVTIAPGAPTITGTVQDLNVIVTGSAAPGASVEVDEDASGAAATVCADGVTGAFTTTLTLSNGTHSLTAKQTVPSSFCSPSTSGTVASVTSPSSQPVVVTVGDVTPPTVTVPASMSVTAPDVSGTTVTFSASAADSHGVPLAAPTCQPPSGSMFPMGSSAVTCEATDANGNVGTNSFIVQVTGAGPTITGSNLVAEALGPAGATVGYQITATGFMANCAPPGSNAFQACTSWQPAYNGLGFIPTSVAIDPNDGLTGALYAGFAAPASYPDPPGCSQSLLKSTDRGAHWQPLTLPQTSSTGACQLNQIAVVPSSGSAPANIYYLSTLGTLLSRDGGATWTTLLPGNIMRGVAADPTNPLHLYAWTDTTVSPAGLFETTDGWHTSTEADDGLPASQILALALDPLNPGRAYLSASPNAADPERTKLYLRTATGPWQRLGVPPYPDSVASAAPSIAISPVLDLCPSSEAGALGQTCIPCPTTQPHAPNPNGLLCQAFPTVFAGTVVSRSGGATWLDIPLLFEADTVLFDRTNPETVYASTAGVFYKSTAIERDDWTSAGLLSAPVGSSIVQDVSLQQTFYAATGMGLFQTSDAGQNWSALSAPGVPLGAGTIRDFAADPSQVNVAYVLMTNGVFKTTDFGVTWSQVGTGPTGVTDPSVFQAASRMTVDRLNHNNVYFGRNGLWKSPNGGADWINVGAAIPLGEPGSFALDPFIPETVIGAVDNRLFSWSPENGESDLPIGGEEWNDPVTVYDLQTIPDPARNVLVSVDETDLENPGSLVGAAVFVSLANFGFSNLVTWGPTVSSFGPTLPNLVFDGSSTSNQLFVGGVMSGNDPSLFFGSPLPTNRGMDTSWHQIGGGNGSPDFTRFVIDAGSSGRSIYAPSGDGPNPSSTILNTLWESHDGGVSWSQDPAAPAQHVNNVWVSPIDGAVYATIMTGNTSTSGRYLQLGADITEDAGSLWKRTPTTGMPRLNTPVVVGNVRAVCTGADPTVSVAPGSAFPIGNTIVNCTATDGFGTPTTQAFTITVQDTTPPVISAPSAISVPSTGQPVPVSFNVTATDTVDTAPTVSCSPPSGSSFSAGTTTVVCTASDHATPTPNVSVASFPVIVLIGNSAPPTLSGSGATTIEATGPDGATADITMTASTSASPPQTLVPTCTPALSSTFPLGTTSVVCSATDPSTHATAGTSFVVTVQDTTAPKITVSISSNAFAARGAWGANVPFTVTATDLVDGAVAVSCTRSGGDAFPLGTTPVDCQAVDKRGNVATASFNVTVADLTPPVLHLKDITVDAQDSTGAFVDYSAYESATDAEDATVGPQSLNCVPGPAPGSPLGTKTWFPFGTGPTTVSCSVSDSNHNQAQGSFTVTVADLSPPEVTVPGTITVEAAGPSGTAVPFTVSALDVVDGPVTPSCTLVGASTQTPVASGAMFPVGQDLVTCVATDRAGNKSAPATFTVVVRDTTPPQLHLPGPITVTADATATALVTYDPVPTASDLVAGDVPVACQPVTGSRFPVGTTTVACTARDAANNATTGTFPVTVQGGGPNGQSCKTVADCASGFCVDGVCCASACGRGDPTDCEACSVAAGGTVDGTCTPLPTTKVCRPSAGACDIAETCTGSSVACPADALAPAATVCRPSAGACDIAETCNGTSATCPADTFVPAATVCRPSTGVCDVAETCTGSSAACPVDAFVPPTTVCRPSTGVCDVAETCTGSSAVCPLDAFARPGTVCRPSAGACDVAETCSGSSVTCPADAFLPANTVCRPSAGNCDVAEACTGTSAACPADGFVPSGTVCQSAANVCQSPGVCSGSVATCPGATAIPGCKLDTTPPVFTNVPSTIVAYATSTSGAKVTYTNPTATDAVDGVRPVTCTPASGSTFKVNKTTVTCTASDKSGNSSQVTFTVWVQYQAPTDGSFFLLPLLANGKAVFPIGPLPLPVVFKLTGASASITNLPATFSATKISSSVAGTTTISGTAGTSPNTGTTFNYVALLKVYDYLWKVSNQTQGTYQITVNLGDGVSHLINVSLKALK
jgi:hypothetical protein